ncbi:MAG: TolC family protein [Xanthomonadales bacterium]|nr:TolC family protein [Xanthomonadales bacterium]
MGAAEWAAELSALPPPLTLGGELENVAGTGPLSGVRSAETTLRLGRVIELGGKREARIAVGATDVARRRHSVQLARIEIAAETGRRFVDVLADQVRVAIARDGVDRAETTLEQVARWVKAGRSPEAEQLQAGIVLGQAKLTLEDAEHELLTARLALSALWGRQDPDFTVASGDLETLPEVEPLDRLAARLPVNADQQALGLDAVSIEARQRAAAAAAKPDVSLSLGVRRFETFDTQALVFSVTVPLGSAPRSALAEAQLQAQLEATQARQEAAGHDSYRRLFALYQELQHARHVFETHRNELIPQAEQALELNQRGYEVGRFSFFVLIQSQQQLAQLRNARVEAAARYHALLVDIDRLTATSGAATP